MSTRYKTRNTRIRGYSVWLIALLVALVATVQIRSQAEVERSLVGIDTTSLAFLIDDLHRANDSLQVETNDLIKRRAALQSGESGAADQVLADEANRLRAVEGLVPVHGPGVVIVIDASGLRALDLEDATGTRVEQTGGGVTVGGALVMAPWTIATIGDATRLAQVADLMTHQLKTDRRVRQANYRVETDVAIRSVVSVKPFVYAVAS
jgi:uncharacterized protein YlxW (UPF0749 family)